MIKIRHPFEKLLKQLQDHKKWIDELYELSYKPETLERLFNSLKKKPESDFPELDKLPDKCPNPKQTKED